MDAGIVPVKQLGSAKSRLRVALGEDLGAALVRALLNDVLETCAQVDALEWWVVTADAEAVEIASAFGFAAIDDPGLGLNGALSHAAHAVKSRGAESMTVIPADVPLAAPVDVRDLLDTGATADMVVVPAGKDGGTNALFLSPSDLLEPRFGRNSLQAHISFAEKAHLRCAVLSVPRLSLDLDSVDDIEDLRAAAKGRGRRTIALLESVSAPS